MISTDIERPSTGTKKNTRLKKESPKHHLLVSLRSIAEGYFSPTKMATWKPSGFSSAETSSPPDLGILLLKMKKDARNPKPAKENMKGLSSMNRICQNSKPFW